MPIKLAYSWLALLLFTLSSVGFSQNSDVGPQVRLVPANGNVYRTGEPIYLSLVFDSQGGEYNLLVSSEQMVSTPDEIVLTPTDGAFDWRARYERGKYFMNDYFGYTKLAEKPINVDLALNDFFRFDKPGRYSVYIKTKRVFADPNLRDPLPLVSNTIDFEITEMTDAEERAEIKRLSALIEAETDWRKQDKFVRELSFLAGDAATVEKVRRFLNPGEYKGNYHHYISKGLQMGRNKELLINLLEVALRDLDREVNRNLPSMLGELRRLAEDSRPLSVAENEASKPYSADKRSLEIRQVYFDEMIQSLRLRTGKSRLVTAYTIFTSLPNKDLSSDAFNTTRAILLEGFDELTPHGKDSLLGHFWEKIKSPVLLPSIEKILESGEPVSYWSYRNLALKRLMEFDQKKARPIVLDEIRDSESRINVEVLAALDDKFLPEVNDALLEQIQNLAATKDHHRLNKKIMLAARYADKTIYQELMKIYVTYGPQWLQETRSGLLGYFIRHNEKEGRTLIEESLAESGDISGGGIFHALMRTNFPHLPNGLEELWRKRLEDDEPEAAGTAAHYLSRYGRKENRKLIEKRHDRWLKKWARAAELDKPEANPGLVAEAMLQVNLIESLIGAKKWTLSAAEIALVRSSCITRTCRTHFQIR